MPLISIITITYNAANTIARTMESVKAQTCTDYEHIIIDGASADSTLSIIRQYGPDNRQKILSEPDDGLYDAMNKGLARAKGKYVMFLNAGDKFHSPQSLAQIKKAIETSHKPGVVYGQTDIVDDNGQRIGPRHLNAPEKLKYTDFSQGMLVCHQAFVALRKITPFFDIRYRFSADYDWCIQCLMHSKENVYTHTVLIDYLSEGITTKNRRKSLRERFNIMCKYYGTLPTIIRHIGFLFRFLRTKAKA